MKSSSQDVPQEIRVVCYVRKCVAAGPTWRNSWRPPVLADHLKGHRFSTLTRFTFIYLMQSYRERGIWSGKNAGCIEFRSGRWVGEVWGSGPSLVSRHTTTWEPVVVILNLPPSLAGA